ncbi:MAG: hypothetical protein ACI3Y5_06920 [Prevotella sp.]
MTGHRERRADSKAAVMASAAPEAADATAVARHVRIVEEKQPINPKWPSII